MKTAVDYLVKAWVEQGTLYAEDIVKAKEIEKQQIIEAFNQSWHDRMNPYKTAEKYYNETFKSE